MFFFFFFLLPDLYWFRSCAHWQMRFMASHTTLGCAQAVASALKTDGYFVLGNWHKRPREETPILGEPLGPKTELRMSPEEAIKLVERAGLTFTKIVEVPPYHYGVVFQRVST